MELKLHYIPKLVIGYYVTFNNGQTHSDDIYFLFKRFLIETLFLFLVVTLFNAIAKHQKSLQETKEGLIIYISLNLFLI